MFWLASYPKSGNTWMRVFLTNLLRSDGQPAHINNLMNAYMAGDNNLIEHYTPYEPSELTFAELTKVRIRLLDSLSNHVEKDACLKIHQANINPDTDETLLKNIKDLLIYIVRNPLDVCLSFTHHQNWKIDQSITFMNSDEAIIGTKDRINQRMGPELLGNWSHHYLSWKNTVPHLLLIRYEDMLQNGLETFSKVAQYVGYEFGEKEIKDAIEKSNIRVLQEQEKETRFKEGSIANEIFFRKGRVGEGKEVLTHKQIAQITSKHVAVMKELGYL